MQYLSKEIEVLAKRKKKLGKSLVRKETSCGIFQNYEASHSQKQQDKD